MSGTFYLRLATRDTDHPEPYILQGYSVTTNTNGALIATAPFVQVPGDCDSWTAGKIPSSQYFTAAGNPGAAYGRANWLLATNGNGIYTSQNVHQLMDSAMDIGSMVLDPGKNYVVTWNPASNSGKGGLFLVDVSEERVRAGNEILRLRISYHPDHNESAGSTPH